MLGRSLTWRSAEIASCVAPRAGEQLRSCHSARTSTSVPSQGRQDREPKVECQREDRCEAPRHQISNEIGLPARTQRIARHSIVPVEYTLHFGRRDFAMRSLRTITTWLVSI